MKHALRFPCLASCLLVSLTCLAQLQTRSVSPLSPPPAHVPPAIPAAKSIFISNAGADSGLFPSPFSGSPDRAYESFFAAMQSWGHYQIVNDPTQADLVLELKLEPPSGPQYKGPNKPANVTNPQPTLHLTVYDRGAHYVLWGFAAPVEDAILQKTHDRNFDLALEELTNDLKRVAQSPAP